MSHDTHEHHHESHNDKPVLEFKSAFYFVLILAGLFIASIGFVKSMSHNEGGHDAHGAKHSEATGHEAHGTEAPHGDASHEATPMHEDHAANEHHEEATPAEHH